MPRAETLREATKVQNQVRKPLGNDSADLAGASDFCGVHVPWGRGAHKSALLNLDGALSH